MRMLLVLFLSLLPHQTPQPTPEQIQGAAVLVDLDRRAMLGDTNAAQALINVVFPDDREWALRVARRESGFRCNADNPRSSASGLFQLMGIHSGRAQRLGVAWQQAQTSCLANLAVARALYDEQGRRPWQ
jgi:hypothetical protein